MNILFIANARMPTEKAHGYQIIKTIEALQAAGTCVELVLPTRVNPVQESIAEYYQVKDVPKIVYCKNWFGSLEFTYKKLYFPLQRISFGLQAWWYAVKSSSDVIFSREITLCYFLALCGKNVVFEDHEPKVKWRGLYQFFLRHIPKKIVVAHSLSRLYNECHVSPGSWAEVPNGVEKEKFDAVVPSHTLWSEKMGIDPTKKIVLYVGHLYAWKGVTTLLESAEWLPEAAVVFVGGLAEDRKKMQSAAREKNITNVFFHEFIPHDQVIPFLKSADVLVLPNTAREERSYKYTTPIKLFEYMSSQVPVVASNLPSFAPYLHHQKNAILFEPDNAQDLAQKIQYIFTHPQHAQQLAHEAWQQSQEYTWTARAQKILSFIS